MINKGFECYSKKLYGFLTMNGMRYERSFKHNQTQRVCWVYEMTPELSDLLKQWSDNSPNKINK